MSFARFGIHGGVSGRAVCGDSLQGAGKIEGRVVAAGDFGEDSGADGLDADYLQFVGFELRVVSL